MISLVVEVESLRLITVAVKYKSTQNTEKPKRKSRLFWDTLPPVTLNAIRFSNVGLRPTLMAPT